MKTADRSKFVHIVAGLAEHYNQEISAPGLDLWWAAMAHWTLDDFTEAANILVRRCKFMPRAADFEDMRRHSVMPATEAWGKVLELLPGAYREGGVDELTDKAVGMLGGYRELAMSPIDSLDFKRRDFVEAYENVIDTQIRAGLLPLRLIVRPSQPKAIKRDPKA